MTKPSDLFDENDASLKKTYSQAVDKLSVPCNHVGDKNDFHPQFCRKCGAEFMYDIMTKQTDEAERLEAMAQDEYVDADDSNHGENATIKSGWRERFKSTFPALSLVVADVSGGFDATPYVEKFIEQELASVNDEWINQPANDHDARIRADERREILELLKNEKEPLVNGRPSKEFPTRTYYRNQLRAELRTAIEKRGEK